MVLSLVLSLVFFVLAVIHFNWFFGGKFGIDVSLPTNEHGKRVLNPKKIDSAIVGLALLAFCCFYFYKSGIIALYLPHWIMEYTGWIISIIFFIRAIGDFKYVGFFKKVKQTTFGEMDTTYFSPLCLVISIVGILIETLN
ncbi:DUF3995 domain-containing protein [Algibacter pacificus]|uniref:DUF3995 domain-containing protein n=1 Tax=Algibacter pacificus TaxID=2599389 RepID=UPI0011C90C06|nr:DUF3995 domain-containing protein [Algibacter pacificus]